MRRFPIEIVIVALCVVFLILGWRIYGAGEMGRFAPAIHAQKAPSEAEAPSATESDRASTESDDE